MERIGEVTAVRGEWLEVTFCRPADCEKCNACHGGQKQTVLHLRGQAAIGDTAVVEMPTETFMRASALAYALPLLLMMAGLLLGSGLFPHRADLAGCIGAISGLAVAALVLKLTEKHRRREAHWQPRLTQIIPKEGANDHGN